MSPQQNVFVVSIFNKTIRSFAEYCPLTVNINRYERGYLGKFISLEEAKECACDFAKKSFENTAIKEKYWDQCFSSLSDKKYWPCLYRYCAMDENDKNAGFEVRIQAVKM